MSHAENITIDELCPMLDPRACAKLIMVLDLTPPERRVAVALAYANITMVAWAREAGMPGSTVWRWVSATGDKRMRMPLGAAFRLAKLLGVEPGILFLHNIQRDDHELVAHPLKSSDMRKLAAVR